MREVTSKTIKAYARTLESVKKSLAADLSKAGSPVSTQFDEAIQALADDIMSVAKSMALAEFEEEWGQP